MIEQIARHLCHADGYDPDIIGLSGNPRWWLYTRTAEHVLPLLAEAWSLGVGVGMLCGPHDIPPNPYRQGQEA